MGLDLLLVRGADPRVLGGIVALAAAALAEDPFLESPTIAAFALFAGAAAAAGGTGAPPRWVRQLSLALTAALVGSITVLLGRLAIAETAVLAYEREVRGPLSLSEEAHAAQRWLRDAALDHDARHPRALYRWAVHLTHQGTLDEARAAFRRALDADPGLTEARLDLAELARLGGRTDEARSILEEARPRDPTRFDIPIRLGHLALDADESAAEERSLAALRLYAQAQRLGPTRFEAPVAFARVYRRAGNLEQAARELQRAKDLVRPDRALPAELLLEGFRLAEAEGAPRELVRGALLDQVVPHLGPAHRFELETEADRLLATGWAEEKAALAKAAVGSRPDLSRSERLYAGATLRYEGLLLGGHLDPRTFLEKARADAKAGEHRRALARLRALFATPAGATNPDLILEAARSAYRTDPAEWRRLFAWGHTLLGEELLAKNDLPAAIRAFTGALEKEPGVPAARIGLARAYARAGRTEEARVELRKAVELDPSLSEKAKADPDLQGLR